MFGRNLNTPPNASTTLTHFVLDSSKFEQPWLGHSSKEKLFQHCTNKRFLTNTSRVFLVEATWKRPFSRCFNVKHTRCICKVSIEEILGNDNRSLGYFGFNQTY